MVSPGPRVRVGSGLSVLLVCFLCWATLSIAWSSDAALTGRRLIALAVVCIAAVALAREGSWRELVGFAIMATASVVVISLGSEIALGTFTPGEEGYRFAGTMHPNAQGQNCVVLALALLAAATETKRKKAWVYRAAVVPVLILLVLTQSRTAIAAAAVGVTLYGLLTTRRRAVAVMGTGCVAIAGLVGALVSGDRLWGAIAGASAAGRSDFDLYTLTGRVSLWRTCLEFAGEHPIVGYGYGGFWTPNRLLDFGSKLGLASAHSEYLEVLLDLGVVGVFVYVAIMATGVATALRSLGRSGECHYAFAAALLVAYCICVSTASAAPLAQLPNVVCAAAIAKLGLVREAQ